MQARVQMEKGCGDTKEVTHDQETPGIYSFAVRDLVSC